MATRKYGVAEGARPGVDHDDVAGRNELQSTRLGLKRPLPQENPRQGPFDAWTRRALLVGLPPLLLWDAVSVYLLAADCGISRWVAWIPALSTSGIMLASTRIAEQPDLEPRVKRLASRLAAFGIVLGVAIAAIHGAMPDDISKPHWGWLALISGLPVAMGGLLYHVYALAMGGHNRTEAERAQREIDEREAARQRTEATEAAERAQRAAEQRAAEQRAAELQHATQLAAIAEQRAAAERAAALAAERKRTIEQTLADQVKTVADGPRPVKPANPTTRKPAPLREKAIAELVRRHRAGEDITTTVAAHLDKAIGASPGYCKKELRTWITQVLAHEQGAA